MKKENKIRELECPKCGRTVVTEATPTFVETLGHCSLCEIGRYKDVKEKVKRVKKAKKKSKSV